MKRVFHGFGDRLDHTVPHWVNSSAMFHVRIRAEFGTSLTANPKLAEALLSSARLYDARALWWVALFVLMPDHLHTLLVFPEEGKMSKLVGNWKRYHARQNGVHWQDGYFDHRIRADERGVQLSEKAEYIRCNPVAAGLCALPREWPWVIDNLGGSRCP